MEFSEYILDLWKRIGYSPPNDNLDTMEAEEAEQVKEVSEFTPVKGPEGAVEKYAGVSIRQFPKDTDHGDIVDFVCRAGLPEEKKSEIMIKSNGAVTIKNLDNETSKILIEAIHGKVNFGKKLYCNGFVPLTPQKQCEEQAATSRHGSPTSTSAQPPSGYPTPSSAEGSSSPGSTSSLPAKPNLLPDIEPNIIGLKTPVPVSPRTVARRHSISLIDRTPPKDSLAAEFYDLQTPSFIRSSTLLNELKVVSEQLSDFGSCLSNLSSSDGSDTGGEVTGGFQTMNEKKRNKKKKRN